MTRRATQAGMTLVEAIAVIAVLAAIGMGISSMILLAAQSQVRAIDLAEVTDVGTITSSWLYTELREMRLPASLGLLSLAPGELRFLDWSGNRMEYTLAGSTLSRSLNGGAPQVFAEGVEEFRVAYRRYDGTPAASAAQVARIDFAITLRRGDLRRRFGGQAWPRSFGPYIANWREE